MTSVESPPVFLIGAARSGTTLLYKSLCLNSEAAYISNWTRKYPRALQLAAFNRMGRAFPALEESMWFGSDSNAYAYGRRRALVERVFPAPVEGEPVFAACGISEDAATSATPEQSRRLRRAVNAIVRFSGGRVFVSKRISHNRRLPLLREVFPDARYVLLTRDGRAVAYSLSRVDWWPESQVWWYGGTPGDWEAEGRDPWELCAQNWVEEVRAIDQGMQGVPESSVYRLSYEDFLARPLDHLQVIGEHAGLPVDRHWMDRVGRLSCPNRNEQWRSRLDPRAAMTIERVQRDELAARGYLTESVAG